MSIPFHFVRYFAAALFWTLKSRKRRERGEKRRTRQARGKERVVEIMRFRTEKGKLVIETVAPRSE